MDKFAGFALPKENWSKLPHELVARFPDFDSQGEVLVVLYILRHTWGFQEFDEGKRISLDEFEHGRKKRGGARMDNGIGMSRNTIKRGIDSAVKHGFIQVVEDASDAARIKRWYSLVMRESEIDSRGSKVNPLLSKMNPRTKKDTLERKRERAISFSKPEKPDPPLDPLEDALERALNSPDDTPIERIIATMAIALQVDVPRTDYQLKPYNHFTDAVVEWFNRDNGKQRKPLSHDQASEVVQAIEWCVTEATRNGSVGYPWNGSSVTAPLVNQVVTALSTRPWQGRQSMDALPNAAEDPAYLAWLSKQKGEANASRP